MIAMTFDDDPALPPHPDITRHNVAVLADVMKASGIIPQPLESFEGYRRDVKSGFDLRRFLNRMSIHRKSDWVHHVLAAGERAP